MRGETRAGFTYQRRCEQELILYLSRRTLGTGWQSLCTEYTFESRSSRFCVLSGSRLSSPHIHLEEKTWGAFLSHDFKGLGLARVPTLTCDWLNGFAGHGLSDEIILNQAGGLGRNLHWVLRAFGPRVDHLALRIGICGQHPSVVSCLLGNLRLPSWFWWKLQTCHKGSRLVALFHVG